MKIPHTIPQFILRAYTRKLTPEELAAQYEGRVLRSEDATWDTDPINGEYKKTGALAETAINQIIKRYPFFVKLTEELNKASELKHVAAEAQWELDLANYQRRKGSFERKTLLQEYNAERRMEHPDDPDYDDDDDDFPKVLKEPEFVPDEFAPFKPLQPVLDRLNDVDRTELIEEIDIEETPLEIAFTTIPDEHYWERAAEERFPEADTDDHGGSWKRLYSERHLRDAIEQFHPVEGDWEKLEKQINLASPFVSTLVLNNLIPLCFGIPRKPIVPPIFEADEEVLGEEDDGYNESEYMTKKAELVLVKKEVKEDEDEDEEGLEKPPRDSSHVDLSLIIPKITKLRKLSIIYEMAETGLDWEPRFFEFTDKDCEILAKTLSMSPTIEVFELQRSRVTDEQTKILVRDGLLLMPHLKVLNMSYNNLGDAGAKALARLITDKTSRVRHTLRTLILARCHFKNKGAKALAYALTINSHLTSLDIRLNGFRNSGGKDFGHALVENKTLIYLNLAANRFTEKAAYILGKMLFHNKTLRELDISSNDLGKKGGEYIALGVRGNRKILQVDVRLTNIGLDFEYDVWAHINKNRAKVAFSLADKDSYFPTDAESQIFDDEEEDEDEDEDEDEEDEDEMIFLKSKKDGSDDDSVDDDDGTPAQNTLPEPRIVPQYI